MRTALATLILAAICAAGETPRLEVARGPAGKPYLAYGGAPLFAFGPGDEMRLTGGAADLHRWMDWQRAHGMNLVRAYPVSVPIGVYGAPGPAPFLPADDGGGWDVDRFNDAYFHAFGETVRAMEARGIIAHIQLWQIVFFKGGTHRWDANFLNPKNNVNAWTRGLQRGRDYIDAPPGSRARAHQREWVRHMLDALHGRGNVIIDVINELGNEMGTIEWAVEVAGWIRAWEAERGHRFPVGVDSEHHYRPGVFEPHADHFDLVILNELKSPAFAREIFDRLRKPVVTVRSSDARNQWEDYVFARADQTGPEHQTRYRTLCYRSLFSNVQSIGAYWKMPVEEADYRDMAGWATAAEALRAFWDRIAPEWPALAADDAVIQGGTVAPRAHALRSDRLTLVYLECGPKSWNNAYPASTLAIAAPGPPRSVEVMRPATGETAAAEHHWADGVARVALPAFTDDLVVIVAASDS